jgi:hypothetical protein
VKTMVSWVEKVSSQLGGIDQLTPEDLLDSKTRFDDNATLEPADDVCATGG